MPSANRARKPSATRQRRASCIPGESATRRPFGSDRAEAGGGLKVTIRVVPLKDPELSHLRARQFAVIVDLLQRATAEAAGRSVVARDDPA
jgi:hypothetical protein